MWTLVNCQILKRKQKNRRHCGNQIAFTRFLYNAGGRSSPSKEELKNCTCSNSVPERLEEPCITGLASRNALDPKQAC